MNVMIEFKGDELTDLLECVDEMIHCADECEDTEKSVKLRRLY